MVIYMYIAPGQGQTTPGPKIFSDAYKSSVHLLIPSKFSAITWHFPIFPIQMHGQPKLTLTENMSRSSKGHDLYKLCRAPFPDASYQVSKS